MGYAAGCMQPAQPRDDDHDVPLDALYEASVEHSGDLAARVTEAASTCATCAAKLSHDCEAMIGACRPVEAFADLIDQTSGCIRHTLQLYDGILDQPNELERFRDERRQVEAELRQPPRHLDAQGDVLDRQAVALCRTVRCQAMATLARAEATDVPELRRAATAAWAARIAQLDRVRAMIPTARHVEMLTCVHPPLPRPADVPPEQPWPRSGGPTSSGGCGSVRPSATTWSTSS